MTGSTSTPGAGPDAGSESGSNGPGIPSPRPIPGRDTCDDQLDNRCGYAVGALPTVYAEDLVSFRPAAPSIATEPAGLGVAGLPTNLVAAASVQHISGDLLGFPVTVRFVPAGFVFDYGDGATQRSASGGVTWARLGAAQFTPTATSHAYREHGTYAASVRVLYDAAVDFGTGNWRPVIGQVTASTSGHSIRIFEARTALVLASCAENPRGPGC
ncbi:hypothetical protein [Microbacterium aoyamense]|uniref:hypothetical protein n=1 Tax=Microbacterium aoyamense TaxID=344166 RepID=UPI00200475E6|nr:hypothetical protein [Microbacterium aoyamense]